MGDALRADDESAKGHGAFGPRLRGQIEQPSEGLHSFSETHIVGEHTAEALRGEVGEELKTFELVGAQCGLEVGRKLGGRQGGDARGTVLQSVHEQGVACGKRLGLERELQDMEAVLGGATTGEHVIHAEAEAVERGGGRGIRSYLGGHFAPAVAREVHPLAAGF